MEIQKPYLLFLGDIQDPSFVKTAFGIRDWAASDCIGQMRLAGGEVNLGLPELSPAQAAEKGAKSLIIGVAPIGGAIPPGWVKTIIDGLEADLDIVSGMHSRLQSLPGVPETAKRCGRQLIDVRHYVHELPIASGKKRRGRRILTVGVDCAVGKKYTALSLTSSLQGAAQMATFRATGQTGIMIAGSGIPIDAVVSDFIAGAAETLSPDNDDNHWDVVEGQGSLFHPAYAGVSLGLLHGSQPDFIVMCQDASRKTIYGYPDFALPELKTAIETNLQMGRLTNPNVRCAGVSVNTRNLSEADREGLFDSIRREVGLPVVDPLVTGTAELADYILRHA